MFTNAGMVQFKNVFTGAESRPYKRATTAQKCVRAGGKHNDLENVGYTARHHTFFEMLGNFSFGDYFKEEAIFFAWNFITKNLHLDKEKLLVTVYHQDEEAAALWKKIAGFHDSKIIKIKTDDNFWRMGDTGPCGPCSEIFIDQGEELFGGPPGSPDEDGDRFLEFWNLVFMQFEELDNGTRISLPKPSVDTGMGLERISAILQGVKSNYDTDLFKNIISYISNSINISVTPQNAASFRAVADHLRSCAFLISDGVLPSNEGRGYVLRRIMRRAMRHLHMLGTSEPSMFKFVPSLVSQMGDCYPELEVSKNLISDNLKLEESKFKALLGRGLKLLNDESGKIKSGGQLSGDVAFKLYDTYGFPLDLTQDVLKSQNITVDTGSFDKAMEKQKALARAAWTGSGDVKASKIWFDIRDKFGATDFLGYSTLEAEALIKAIVVDDALVDSAKEGDSVAFVVNQTPFYGESGGQLGDIGLVFKGLNHDAVIEVSNSSKEAVLFSSGVIVHHGTVKKGSFAVGDSIILKVDAEHRLQIAANHSATHLLHEALRRTLGNHIAQKGSLVAPNRLRFDFTHNYSISQEDLDTIEDEVNRIILRNTEVKTSIMSPDEAAASGARALFGEKYSDEVRVLFIGSDDNTHYSIELCGGTHANRTGDIGFFKIIQESAVSSGVRRIEALTGKSAFDWVRAQTAVANSIASHLNSSIETAPDRILQLLSEVKRLNRENSDLLRKAALASKDSSNDEGFETINGIPFLGKILNNIPAKELKPMADEARAKFKSGVIALVSSYEDKASIVVSVSPDLTPRVNAVDIVKLAVEHVGGKGGGGRPDMAQAGGALADKDSMSKAMNAIRASVECRV